MEGGFLRNYHPRVSEYGLEGKNTMLNQEYLRELADEIHDSYNEGDIVYTGTKSGVYFLAGVFMIEEVLVPLVKIGMAVDFNKREYTYHTENPSTLHLIYFVKMFKKKKRIETERYYHSMFRPHRVRGEWFELKPIAEKMGLDWNRLVRREDIK